MVVSNLAGALETLVVAHAYMHWQDRVEDSDNGVRPSIITFVVGKDGNVQFVEGGTRPGGIPS